METTKLCKCCNTTKEINQFNKNNTKRDGLSSECKECVKEYKRKYRLRNSEKIKESKKKYYHKNKDKVLTDNQKWKELNREYHNKCSKEYNRIHSKKVSLRMEKYYKENKEEIDRKNKLWGQTEAGKLSKRNTHYKRKMAIKNGISTSELVKYTKNINECYWCSVKLDKSKKNSFHIDHYIPISKGGKHSLDNIVVSCPKCNILKSNKCPYSFALSVGKLL